MAPASGKVSARRVATGVALSAATVVGTKFMSLIAQVILGHIFTAHTYGIFAAATAALVFVTGLQNSGVAKLLIQQPGRFDELAPSYAGFAVILGLVGSLLMLPVGIFMSAQNEMPTLFWVLLFACVSIPLASIYSVAIARYIVELRYEESTVNTLLKDLIYYVALISAALLGAAEYSVAIATLSAVALLLPWVARRNRLVVDLRGAIRNSWSLAKEVRWTILSSYLFGLTQSGDYLVLGSILGAESLGVYYFGYMLAGNVGTLVSIAVSQTLMPALANIRNDAERLKRAVIRSSGVIVTLAGMLCIGLVGLGEHVIHFVWNGKWDASTFVAVAIATTFPIRIMASLAAVIFEAQGQWRTRSLFVLYDAVGLMSFAAAGGWYAGIEGAAVAVAAHRGLAGIISYPWSLKHVGFSGHEAIVFAAQLIAPFVVAVGVLLALKGPAEQLHGAWGDLLLTVLVLGLFGLASRGHLREVLRTFLKR